MIYPFLRRTIIVINRIDQIIYCEEEVAVRVFFSIKSRRSAEPLVSTYHCCALITPPDASHSSCDRHTKMSVFVRLKIDFDEGVGISVEQSKIAFHRNGFHINKAAGKGRLSPKSHARRHEQCSLYFYFDALIFWVNTNACHMLG